ncbi:MAG: YceI family protein [Crocinitomicaceae bacterium]|nr:YceI family protein [Crocinitomicaceae bacterium]
MTTVLILSFICIGLTAIVLQAKSERDFGDFLNLLVLVALSSALITEVDVDNKGTVFALMGIGAINFVASQIIFLRKPAVRILVPLISIIAYFLMFKDVSVVFTGKAYPLVNKFLVIGAIISVAGYEFGKLKLKVISKLFGEVEEEELIKSVLIFFVGVAVFLSVFQSGMLGLLVVATAYLSTSFYRSEEGKTISSTLLSLSVIPYLLIQSDYNSVNLMGGDVLAGLFFGAFGVYFLQKLWMSKKRNMALILLGYVIVLGISYGLLYGHMIHANMGGMDAFIGIIIGAALVIAVKGVAYVGTSLMAFLIVGGILIPPYMINNEAAEFENDRIIVDELSEDGEEAVYVSLGEMIGDYSVDEEKSSIAFVMGEEGETTGAFKAYSGKISIAENLEESSFEILLDLENFTTFNSFRDGSLMDDTYLNAEKFPTMSYKGNSITSLGDNTYEIQGEFTMLGVSKDLTVSLFCVETEEGNMLIGKGDIDRTLFGMTPSAEEGDVVSFDYSVGLIAK